MLEDIVPHGTYAELNVPRRFTLTLSLFIEIYYIKLSVLIYEIYNGLVHYQSGFDVIDIRNDYSYDNDTYCVWKD